MRMEVDYKKKVIKLSPERGKMFCDFCYSPEVKWAHEAKDFKFPGPLYVKSIGPWAACSACHSLIENNRRAELLDRSVEAHRKLYPEDEVNISFIRGIMNISHAAFWQNRTGKYEKL